MSKSRFEKHHQQRLKQNISKPFVFWRSCDRHALSAPPNKTGAEDIVSPMPILKHIHIKRRQEKIENERMALSLSLHAKRNCESESTEKKNMKEKTQTLRSGPWPRRRRLLANRLLRLLLLVLLWWLLLLLLGMGLCFVDS